MGKDENYFSVNFTCPHCGRPANVVEEEVCPIQNIVYSFDIDSWIGTDDIVEEACDASPILGLPKIIEPDVSHSVWICSECNSIIDEDIRNYTQLFNYLLKNKMVIKTQCVNTNYTNI